jgi:retinol dehydrogenase-12
LYAHTGQAFNPGNLNTELTRHLMVPYFRPTERLLQGLVLWPARYGAYTELYAGLSPELTIEEHSGAYIWPWGRVGHLRPDIEESMGLEYEGGTGKAAKLWAWCDQETVKFT